MQNIHGGVDNILQRYLSDIYIIRAMASRISDLNPKRMAVIVLDKYVYIKHKRIKYCVLCFFGNTLDDAMRHI